MSPDDPRHGTYAGALAHYKDGTDYCEPCREAKRIWNKRKDVRLGKGIRNRVTLGRKAWEKLGTYEPTVMAAASGLNAGMLVEIRKAGPDVPVLRSTRDRILAARPTHTAIGIQRRLRALVAIGYSATDLGLELGRHHQSLRNVLNRSKVNFIQHDYALEILAMYARLEHTPSDRPIIADRMRRQARTRGWHAPLAWDDIDIDEAPADAADPPRRPGPEARLDLDEYDRLILFGESPEQAARRFGVTLDAVEVARARAAQKDAA